jgi:cobalamin synthase
MKNKILLALAAGVAAGLLVLAGAEPALAAGSDLGRNLGREVRSWATALLLGVAALVAIPVLARRDVNGGLVLALLVLVLGGFAFAQGTVRQIIVEVWRALV